MITGLTPGQVSLVTPSTVRPSLQEAVAAPADNVSLSPYVGGSQRTNSAGIMAGVLLGTVGAAIGAALGIGATAAGPVVGGIIGGVLGAPAGAILLGPLGDGKGAEGLIFPLSGLVFGAAGGALAGIYGGAATPWIFGAVAAVPGLRTILRNL